MLAETPPPRPADAIVKAIAAKVASARPGFVYTANTDPNHFNTHPGPIGTGPDAASIGWISPAAAGRDRGGKAATAPGRQCQADVRSVVRRGVRSSSTAADLTLEPPHLPA
ncbi:MAG TPA: hypothetical protein VGE11_11035 [Pseudonocardia sp.]